MFSSGRVVLLSHLLIRDAARGRDPAIHIDLLPRYAHDFGTAGVDGSYDFFLQELHAGVAFVGDAVHQDAERVPGVVLATKQAAEGTDAIHETALAEDSAT